MIPRIAGSAVERIFALITHKELGNVGLSQENSPGLPQARNTERVNGGAMPGKRFEPDSGGSARHVERFLYREGQTGERSWILSSVPHRVNRGRIGSRL